MSARQTITQSSLSNYSDFDESEMENILRQLSDEPLETSSSVSLTKALKKKEVTPWWSETQDDGFGQSTKSFLKSKNTSKSNLKKDTPISPIRTAEKVLHQPKTTTFNDTINYKGGVQPPESTFGESLTFTDSSTSKPFEFNETAARIGQDTLEEIADKQEFFKQIENTSADLDYGLLNRQIDIDATANPNDLNKPKADTQTTKPTIVTTSILKNSPSKGSGNVSKSSSFEATHSDASPVRSARNTKKLLDTEKLLAGDSDPIKTQTASALLPKVNLASMDLSWISNKTGNATAQEKNSGTQDKSSTMIQFTGTATQMNLLHDIYKQASESTDVGENSNNPNAGLSDSVDVDVIDDILQPKNDRGFDLEPSKPFDTSKSDSIDAVGFQLPVTKVEDTIKIAHATKQIPKSPSIRKSSASPHKNKTAKKKTINKENTYKAPSKQEKAKTTMRASGSIKDTLVHKDFNSSLKTSKSKKRPQPIKPITNITDLSLHRSQDIADAVNTYLKQHFRDISPIARSNEGGKVRHSPPPTIQVEISEEVKQQLQDLQMKIAVQAKEFHEKEAMLKENYEKTIINLQEENFALTSRLSMNFAPSNAVARPKDAAEVQLPENVSASDWKSLQKQLHEQEQLIAGYQKENEKLYAEIKTKRSASRGFSGSVVKENRSLLVEITNLKEDIKVRDEQIQHLVSQNSSTANQSVIELQTLLKQSKIREEEQKQTIERLSRESIDHNRTIDLLTRERDNLQQRLQLKQPQQANTMEAAKPHKSTQFLNENAIIPELKDQINKLESVLRQVNKKTSIDVSQKPPTRCQECEIKRRQTPGKIEYLEKKLRTVQQDLDANMQLIGQYRLKIKEMSRVPLHLQAPPPVANAQLKPIENESSNKEYSPSSFTGRHITEVILENTKLKQELDLVSAECAKLRQRQESLIMENKTQNEKLKSEYTRQLEETRVRHENEMRRVITDQAVNFSKTQVAELRSKLSSQEMLIKHLRDQLLASQATESELESSREREERLAAQVKKLLNDVLEAKAFQSPTMRHFDEVQSKIENLQLKLNNREKEIRVLIEQNSRLAAEDLSAELVLYKEMLAEKNSEIDRFRTELDEMLEILQALQRQGVKISLPQSNLVIK